VNSRIVLLAAIASLFGGAMVASAEPRSISVQSGRSTPVGDLADEVGEGIYVGVSANQPIGDQELLFLDLDYHVLGDKTTILLPGYLSARESMRITETAIGLRALLAPPRVPISPYLKLGVALEFVEPSLVLDTASEAILISTPHFWPGFLGGIGVSVPLGGSAGLRLEGSLRAIAADPKFVNFGSVGLSLWTRFAQP
jgi:hypothetical protein